MRRWLAALPWILRIEAKFGSHRRACALDEQELIRKTAHNEFHQIINSMHGPRCGGFFVEAGANTGVNSVTKAFERIGWHGLCVEANPYLYHNFLVKNRQECENIHAALVDGPDQVVFRAYTERLGDLSGIESFRTPKQWAKMEREHANDKRKWKLERTNVTALSPAKLVFGRGHVDLFSLDVEGAELCGKKKLRRVRAESSRRPLRHRRDACSIAWWCSFLTARPSQDGRAIAEK